MRILEGRAADSYVRKAGPRGQSWTRWSRGCGALCTTCAGMAIERCASMREQWDGLSQGKAAGSEREMQAALKAVTQNCDLRSKTAAENIRNFCEWQKPWNGSGRSRAASWANWCVRSVPWDVMCPADAIPCPRLC